MTDQVNDVNHEVDDAADNPQAGSDENALAYYNEMLSKAQADEDYPNVVVALQQLAAVYHTRGDDDEAGDFYRQALEIAEEVDDREGIAGSLAQLGALFFKKEEFAESLRHVARAFVIYRELDSPNVRQLSEVVNMLRTRVPNHLFAHVLSQHELKEDDFTRPRNEDANLFLNNIIILTKSAVDARAKGTVDEGLINNLESAGSQLPHAAEAQGFRAYFNMLLQYARGEEPTNDGIPEELVLIFEKIRTD